MRFCLGSPFPPPSEFPLGEWKPLREPGPLVMQLYALPLGGVIAACVGYLWIHATTVWQRPVYVNSVILFGSLIAFLPVHEILHAAVHPSFGMSSRTVLGFWPSRNLAYAYYDGVLSRNRFIAVLAVPFLVLTLAPLLCYLLAGKPPVPVAFISTLNALASGGDLFAIGLLVFQVPCRALLFNRGYFTYWSVPAP